MSSPSTGFSTPKVRQKFGGGGAKVHPRKEKENLKGHEDGDAREKER